MRDFEIIKSLIGETVTKEDLRYGTVMYSDIWAFLFLLEMDVAMPNGCSTPILPT